jgi:cysteine synthase
MACKAIRPRIVKTFDSFKTFWAAKVTLVNQTAVPASQYGYRMAATNDDDSVVSYSKSIPNFGAVYATTKESVKLQGTTITAMQSQFNPLSQYCMALQQQATPTNHTAQQQRGASNNWRGLDQRNSKVATAVAAVAAAAATTSQRIHCQEQRANVQITPPRRTSASKTGTTATLTVATSTMGTPVGHVPNRAPCTIHMQQGPT